MNWNHVQLIFRREMMDQLRDRRTLFTITILPLLLYPLLGMLLMQVAQFHRENSVRICVVGHENWPEQFPIWNSQGKLTLESLPESAYRLIEFELIHLPELTDENVDEQARKVLRTKQADAVLVVSSQFSRQITSDSPSAYLGMTKESSVDVSGSGETDTRPMTQGLSLVTNLARDQSSIAYSRMSALLERWWDSWRSQQLEAAGFSKTLSTPIRLDLVDTSVTSVRQAVKWSKILPFVMLVWALTGAFYPAIDLCAGEKERGTLETLLSSPARRREIVWGKLLTINVFSITSALLNLTSMQITAGLVVKSLSANSAALAESLGPVPMHAMGWLILLLIPMSAFFSGLALAIAALAKSTKEGQYYLMPLLLVTLPLVALPMIPSMEMNLGTSLIPVSGAVFLVRSLIEGRIAEAVIHLPVVVMVTLFCCWLATRWAIRQFESETVMFHENGRWDLRIWLRHLWRDREDTAKPSVALLCGVLILVARFFAQFFVGSDPSFVGITLLVQVGLILGPCLLMAFLLTRHPRRALRIHRAQWSHVVAAVFIGFALHPSYQVLGQAIVEIYPIGQETMVMLRQFESLVFQRDLWLVLLLLAAVPAVCEELAFRGFIFGGLLRKQGVLRAIIVSSLLFGFTHAVLQQSITASLMGLMLGLIAWRTGGVFCTIIVHAISNSLTLTMAWCGKHGMAVPDVISWAVETNQDGWAYSPQWHFMSIVLSVALLLILFQRSRQTERVVLAEMA